MKATIYHWNEYVQECPQEVLWSFTLTPRCFSIRFLLRSRARRDPLWMRMQMHNGIVIQSYLHSCTTRCDVMWCHNVMYNTEIIKILTLRVQIALSLRQHLNIIGLYWKAQYDSLQPHICIMHAVINDNIINNNNLVICYSVF